MDEQTSRGKRLFFIILIKCYYLYQLIIHFMFKMANFGKKEELPPINNLILLSSASDLAIKIRKKKLKSVDLIQAYITRIEEVNPYINAVVENRFHLALKEAQQVDELIASGKKTEERLEKDTPFLGVPFTCKELTMIKGLKSTAGLVDKKDHCSSDDADVIKLMKKSGAILIATTNVSEFGIWCETFNKVYGITNNPYDFTRTPGGSTGGEGAIISSAGSVFGIGSDLGGSIRVPSCFNGIFGHKPTLGSVLNNGMLAYEKKIDIFLSPGPMCRYAVDLLPLMKVLAGPTINQLNTPVNIKNLKIYYMEEIGVNCFYTKVQPDIKNALKKVLYHFEQAYQIKPQKLNIEELKYGMNIWLAKIIEKGGFSFLQEMTRGGMRINVVLELLLWFIGQSKFTFPPIAFGLLEKIWPSEGTYLHTLFLNMYSDLIKYFQDVLGKDGIFLYPTWPESAPYHYEIIIKSAQNCSYTSIFNVLGFPVTHCPLGLDRNQLPIGLQVVSNLHNDHLCIAFAVELEKAFGGWVCPSKIIE